jgi:enterochelin esterase-like enzyme
LEQLERFPGTERKYWVYVPAQYDAKLPAAVMVFQDGGGYVKRDGGWRVPVVFDNLIAKKEMPVTVGIFINPGEFPAKPGEAGQQAREEPLHGIRFPRRRDTRNFCSKKSCPKSERR